MKNTDSRELDARVTPSAPVPSKHLLMAKRSQGGVKLQQRGWDVPHREGAQSPGSTSHPPDRSDSALGSREKSTSKATNTPESRNSALPSPQLEETNCTFTQNTHQMFLVDPGGHAGAAMSLTELQARLPAAPLARPRLPGRSHPPSDTQSELKNNFLIHSCPARQQQLSKATNLCRDLSLRHKERATASTCFILAPDLAVTTGVQENT